ncbi:hypothetical protein AN641_05385 [Candidatus Epulonipiscioides gigas]|nr:hypothetical protein AN641_05385 [Epulopiscium sp. SCG-C07WGA-EpuloA2]
MFNIDKSLDINKLDFAAKTFFYTTRLPIAFLNHMGDIIFLRGKKGKQAFFCTLFEDCTKENCPCQSTHLYAGKESYHLGEPYIFMCPAGLTQITMAIVVEGIFKGFFISGGFLMTSADEFCITDIYDKYKIADEHKIKLSQALHELIVISPSLTRYYANAIECITSSVMLTNTFNLKEKNKRALQQRKIGETLQQKKYIYNADYSYPFQKEKELIEVVKSGQTREASVILNDLLGHILFSYGNDLNAIKPRVLELCTIISRVTLESTKRIENTLSLNAIFLQKLVEAPTLEDLAFVLQKIIKEFSDEILELNNTALFVPIRRAINYLNTYYADEISLIKVAKFVHLTPSYFSTIFKKETGYSFTQYLNRIRIEHGKLLLLDTSLTILEIAVEVGFDTDTYFCTVFKKITGITPNQYRNNSNM